MINGNKNAAEHNLMTPKEAAEMIRMSISWLEKQRCRKTGIPYIKIGGKIFYDKTDLVAWIKRSKTKH